MGPGIADAEMEKYLRGVERLNLQKGDASGKTLILSHCDPTRDAISDFSYLCIQFAATAILAEGTHILRRIYRQPLVFLKLFK